MSDGKPNERQIKNSLLSGASNNYLFEDLAISTVLLPVPDPPAVLSEEIVPETSADVTSEIDLNAEDNGISPPFSHFVPPDIPQVSSTVFQSPPTPSSVQLFTLDHGQYNLPTQAISSPLISSDSYSSMGSSSAVQLPFVPDNPHDTQPQAPYADQTMENANDSSTFSAIRQTLTTLVGSLTSGYSSFSRSTDIENNPMNLQSTNTSTTAGVGNAEITNVTPSSYNSNVHRRIPEPFGALQTPPIVQHASSSSGQSNNFRLSSQKPVYAPFPGLINSPSGSNPPLPVISPVPPSQPNPPYVPAYNTANELGSSYVFGAPVPHATPHYAHDNRHIYQPVSYHWFYRRESDGRLTWKPFSLRDSVALEDAYITQSESPVATDGGRHDVYVSERVKKAVYWDEEPVEVRRCSWFFKGPMDSRFVPYDEEFSSRLEEEYCNVMTSGVWHKRLEFPDGEAIVFHNANVIVHFCKAAAPDEWGSVPESQLRPRVVKRGVGEEFEIQDGESSRIDHLVFLVHGIGAICDFKFRCIDEAVDGFRSISVTLMQTHFKEATDAGVAGRIEFLPVSWHKALHGDRGVDEQLKKLTLHSIPKLRHFTNDTLLDILFYTSPKYCQTIIKTVGNEMNKMYRLFMSRNQDFNGMVAVGGHSLGSLILFDLLYHQPGPDEQNTVVNHIVTPDTMASPTQSQINIIPDSVENLNVATSELLIPHPGSTPKMVSFSLGAAGTGQPFIVYPILEFKPTAFFAMGSPIAMFVTVRGLEKLGENFHLPTCPSYFNIFHPYDPVAYRIEPLIVEDFYPEPVLIPHHKGRKRFHLELKDTMIRFGSDIKSKFVDSVLSTFNTVYSFGYKKAETSEVDSSVPPPKIETVESTVNRDSFASRLNRGRRIDYVLQEAPVESINEYLFALSSHVCYWESEDTMLMIMREIYNSLGVNEDSTYLHNQNGVPLQGGEMDHSDIGPAAKVLMKTDCCETPEKSGTQTPLKSVNTYASPQPTTSQSILRPESNQRPLPNITPPLLPPMPQAPLFIPQASPSAYTINANANSSLEGLPPSYSASCPTFAPNAAQSAFRPAPLAGIPHTIGMDPTAPPSSASIGPPPLAGFQRRT